MAVIHRAETVPSKLELLAAWIGDQPWWRGGSTDGLTKLGAYRFDDPAGEVGIEAIVIGTGAGPALHVPLTYRGAPLEGGDGALIGTMEHSVLGTRWVYDGCGDPVAVTAFANAALAATPQARELVEGVEERTPSAIVTGSGGAAPVAAVPGVADLVVASDDAATTVVAPSFRLVFRRLLDDEPSAAAHVLVGTWQGSPSPRVLASVTLA